MKRFSAVGMYSGMLVIFSLMMAVLPNAHSAQAASVLNSCTTYCHGIPPRDAVRKANPHFNSMSSAFSGNHQTHMKSAPSAADCSICHTPVAATNFGHQDDVISMANSLKGYSSATLRAKYDKAVFFNQTSIPNLTNATCSNVSCHFEKKTPVWGSAAYNVTTDCNACHGAPPAGIAGAPAGGLGGSHARHDAYFPGTANCQKCHPGYATFIHATSAGRSLKVQGYLRDPLNILEASGTYSGTGVNYLPSKSSAQIFGVCSNMYCHSSGQSSTGSGAGTTVTTPAWGGSALNCGSCHQNMGPAVNAAATGKHARHAQTAGISCSVCHGAGYTGTTVPTGDGTIHVNKSINLVWTGIAATPATTYSKGNTFAAGASVYGSCSTSYCHSTVQNATTGANSAVTYRSVSWASATLLTCAGCHVDMATDATGTGGHKIHTISTGANLDCARCHLGYTKTTSAAATHANGFIDLGAAGFTYSQGSGPAHPAGNGYGTCSASACHGSAAVTWGGTLWSTTDQCGKCHSSPAGAVTAATPFYSTSFPTKVTAITDPKVGAHTSHITGSDNISSIVSCFDCHGAVALNSPTHMSGSTSFNWSPLAMTGGLTPVYNPASGTCSSVYCHGAAMPGGDTSGSNRTPVWNSTTYLPATLSAAACGTCHGFPPTAASGHPSVVIPAGFPATASIGTTCSCHPNVNTAGNSYATIFIDKTLHINGIVDVAAGGACDTCHGYPPASVGFVGTQGNWSNARTENYLGGGGAHTVNNHVSKLATPGDGFASCSKCHDAADHQMSPISFNPSQNIKVRVSQRYRFEAAKQHKYSSNRLDAGSHLTGTCSNSSCHFGATPKWDPNH